MGRMVMEFFTFRMRRRMSNQRPRAAEHPSADDDETVEDLVPGREGEGQGGSTREGGSERGQLGTEGEGGERYPESDGEQTRMAMLLDGDFSGIAIRIAMLSCFPPLLKML